MKIALNMFSVRESMEKDPDKTIEELPKWATTGSRSTPAMPKTV